MGQRNQKEPQKLVPVQNKLMMNCSVSAEKLTGNLKHSTEDKNFH